jgi:hypothetical protein
MSYATPFYYAAKAVQSHEYTGEHHHHLRPAKRRRRRIRLVLFPAQRPQTPVAAATSDC